MPPYNTPGVYIEEVSTLPPSVAQVATAIPAFIGFTQLSNATQSDVEIVQITSMLEYEEHFGGPKATGFCVLDDGSISPRGPATPEWLLYYSLSLYFKNGGGRCYVVSVGDYDQSPSADAFARGLQAIEREDEPTLIAMPDLIKLDRAGYLSVSQQALALCAKLGDRFAILDVPVEAATLVGGAGPFNLSNSREVELSGKTIHFTATAATVLGAGPPNLADLSGKLLTLKLGQTEVPVAFDSNELELDDVILQIADASNLISATNVAGKLQIKSVLEGASAQLSISGNACQLLGLTPGTYNGTGNVAIITVVTADEAAAVVRAVSPFDAGVGADGLLWVSTSNPTLQVAPLKNPFGFSTDSVPARTYANFRDDIGNNDLDYGAAYHPYLVTTLTHHYDEAQVKVGAAAGSPTLATLGDQTTRYNQIKKLLAEQRVVLPPSAAVAGIYARVDRERGVWKAPANVGVASVIGPVEQITHAQQDLLNIDPTSGKSINAIRAFSGKGTLVWGARTLAGNSNEWRYVSVRRLFIMVEESAKKASAFAVFEPNDATTWLKVKGMLDSYLFGLWEQGALQGGKPDAAFYVHVGLGKTMTPQDVLEGRMIVQIGIAAVRPAEFIVLRFSHKLASA